MVGVFAVNVFTIVNEVMKARRRNFGTLLSWSRRIYGNIISVSGEDIVMNCGLFNFAMRC